MAWPEWILPSCCADAGLYDGDIGCAARRHPRIKGEDTRADDRVVVAADYMIGVGNMAGGQKALTPIGPRYSSATCALIDRRDDFVAAADVQLDGR